MIYLFSRNGLKFLESACFARTLFAFDYDGTLAKIVKNPNEAKINRTTLRLLQKLSETSSIAVISGRSLSDLKDKFDPPPGFLIGNHGLEGILANSQKLEVFENLCKKWKSHLKKTLLDNEVNPGGIEIEDKGYSIAVHYRKSRTKRFAKSLILKSLAMLTPSARIIMGKCVVNIIPVGAPHKGIALLEVMRAAGVDSALYVGDDDTDEDVFALTDTRILTVRVGKKKNSRAKFYVERQAEIQILLQKIVTYSKSGLPGAQKASNETRKTP
ncbi:MAG: trehalose-phosphatase [Bdellovibrionales bacterium]